MQTVAEFEERQLTVPTPAKIELAPGEAEYKAALGLAQAAISLGRKATEINLLKGIIYILLKQAYEEYKTACKQRDLSYKNGDVLRYESFKASFGFKLDSQGWITELTAVAARYIVEYGMASYRLQWREDTPTLDWQAHEALRIELIPSDDLALLTGLPHELLYHLIDKQHNYHTSAEQARALLTTANEMKRSDFWRWLIEQPTYNPHQSALVDESQDTSQNARFHEVIRKQIDTWLPKAEGFDWNDLFRDIIIPDTVRGLSVTIEVQEVAYGKG